MAKSDVADLFENCKVDVSKPIPFHVQVYETLEGLIGKGLRSGDLLPSEPKLCDLFGVSRTVIRQALEQLDRDGLIVRVMGKGTFVAQPKISESLVGRLTGFYEDMVQQGYTPVSKILRQQRIEADARIARKLLLNIGDPVIVMRRLRFVQDVPLQLVTSYLPFNLCEAVLYADFTHQSLYAFLSRECNLHIARGNRSIEAVLANEEEAALLEIKQGAPLILLDSVSYLENGRPLEYYKAVHRSDRARFEVHLLRMADNS